MTEEDKQIQHDLLMAMYAVKRIEETRKETIDKAIRWLESQGAKDNDGAVMISIEDFKKAMEE